MNNNRITLGGWPGALDFRNIFSLWIFWRARSVSAVRTAYIFLIESASYCRRVSALFVRATCSRSALTPRAGEQDRANREVWALCKRGEWAWRALRNQLLYRYRINSVKECPPRRGARGSSSSRTTYESIKTDTFFTLYTSIRSRTCIPPDIYGISRLHDYTNGIWFSHFLVICI